MIMGEKIIDVILPKEVIFKEENGDSVNAQLRHGQIENNIIYKNRQVINTRYGQLPIIPRVKMYFKAHTDDDSTLIIDIFNSDTSDLFKKFIIKSANNNFSINDMRKLTDNIKNILSNSSSDKIKSLIELIRNNDLLKYEEIAQ